MWCNVESTKKMKYAFGFWRQTFNRTKNENPEKRDENSLTGLGFKIASNSLYF